jgi:predicted ATPase
MMYQGTNSMEERSTLSVICPTLIGREDDLAALQQFVEKTKYGYGQLAFVSGEAGVGKSRLIAETAHFARQQGFFHLEGHCFQSDDSLPYAPFLDLLRSYIAYLTPEQIM